MERSTSATRNWLTLFFITAAIGGIGLILPKLHEAAGKLQKKAVVSDAAPKAIGPYSQAIVVGDFVYLSGQVGTNPQTGRLADGGVEAECEQAIRNLEVVLKAAGSDLSKVVKTTIFLADINDFNKVNEIYARNFPEPFPARSTVQVARLPRDARIEIEVTAIRSK